MIDNENVALENSEYQEYMLSFLESGNTKKAFMSVLPCTLTYEYIGKKIKEENGNRIENNYYGLWIETYSSKSYEDYCEKTVELINRMCKDCKDDEVEELLDIYITACEFEMRFWDMCYRNGVTVK